MRTEGCWINLVVWASRAFFSLQRAILNWDGMVRNFPSSFSLFILLEPPFYVFMILSHGLLLGHDDHTMEVVWRW